MGAGLPPACRTWRLLSGLTATANVFPLLVTEQGIRYLSAVLVQQAVASSRCSGHYCYGARPHPNRHDLLL